MRSFYESFWADAPTDPEPWAWERRRALLLAEARPGERVLDLGCGAGRFLAALRDAGAEPVGVEIAEAAVERARANVPGADVRLLEPDGTIPAAHGEFDLVWCSEVLEHIPDVGAGAVRGPPRAQARRAAAARPSHASRGCAALLRFERDFDPLGQHVRFFTRRSLARTLDATGFDDRVASAAQAADARRRALRRPAAARDVATTSEHAARRTSGRGSSAAW